ncbi:RNA pseudouridylate synthase, partial [Reticulomyxa filosa]
NLPGTLYYLLEFKNNGIKKKNVNVPPLEHMNNDNDDFHFLNQRRPSLDLSKPYYIKQKRQRPDDDDDSGNDQMQRSKKSRMNADIRLKISTLLNDNSDEQKEELDDKNILKKSRKIRREYFCNKLHTLVITPVNGISFKSQTSVLKLFGQHGKTIKAHTFSTTWRTMYVHFDIKISVEMLQEITVAFNQKQQSIMENSKSSELESEKKKQHRIMLCSYVKNPDVNRYVLLKNVSIRESEKEILETLKDLNLNVEKVERFKGLPMVKVLFANSQDVRQLLQTGSIQIGFEHASCEPFDYNRNRPKNASIVEKQIINQRIVSINASKANINAYCVMDIGVNLSRKEKLFILKKEQKGNPTENKTGQKTNNIQILSKNKESESTRKVDAPKFINSKSNGAGTNNKKDLINMISKNQNQSQNKQNDNNQNNNDINEISQLRKEISYIRLI